MHNVFDGFTALAGGAFLGLIFFAGLGWTISRGLAGRLPIGWYVAGFWLRLVLVLTGFLLVSETSRSGSETRLLLCLVGFQLARIGATYRKASLET
jgi:F1F0 ATPase subunit 2